MQGRDFALFLLFILSLKIAFLKEWPWAIRSLQKSNKSESLFYKECREWFARFLRANCTFAVSLSQTRSDLLKKIRFFHHVSDSFSLLFPFFMPKSELQFHSFADKNQAIRSKKQRANFQGWEFAHLISERIARFLSKNERMSDSLK